MYEKFFKRFIDIIFAIIALPILLFFTIIIGLAIKIDDGGPVFYKSKRIGKNSKIYDMYKFRSMKVDSPNILNVDGSTYNSKNDNRVTKVGRFIRETSLDELPQFFNVLIGNMSICGPRASDLEAMGTFKDDEIDKMKVKPGITGYCQAYYRNGLSVREKRLKDAWYANNVNFWLDFKIFFKTIITVLKKENIYTNDTTKDERKKYLFLSNDSKQSNEIYESRDLVKINSMRKPCFDAISDFDYDIYMGINKKYATELEVDYPKKIGMYDAHIYRNIFNVKDNLKAYKALNIFLKKEKVDVIHCNTPIGGVLGRICGKKFHVNKIIYTAHGFHFFKGNNVLKNFIFKNVEKFLAHYTDAIITMNQEDFEAAQKFKLKNHGKVYFTHGVGIDLSSFKNVEVDRNKKREELGISEDDIVLISMGDLVKRKNYSLSLEIIAKCNNPKIKYLICGNGPELEKLKKQVVRLGIDNQVCFLGFRSDIKELLKISDIFLFTSLQEGLPRSLMEAMASGLPCVVSKIRGNIDLIDDGKGGYCCNLIDDYLESINKIIGDVKLTQKMINYNNNVIKQYSIESVIKEVKAIYSDIGL